MSLDLLDRQRLDLLAGVRGANSDATLAAVRRKDMAGFVKLSPMTASRITSGSTVSVAEYNAVVADLAALWQAISQLTASIK